SGPAIKKLSILLVSIILIDSTLVKPTVTKQAATIMAKVLATLLTPPIFNITTTKSISSDAQSVDMSEKICKYSPNPLSANALLKSKESHNPNPTIVPKRGPKALSV